MIVQKLKGHRLLLNKKESNELESYTLIHLNDIETKLFLNECHIKYLKNRLIIKYNPNDSIIDLFTRFANEHRLFNSNFKSHLNQNYIYESSVKGDWYLKRNVAEHTIALLRREDNLNNLNKICIDNDTAKSFCKDCMLCKKPNNKKWLHMEDDIYYTYWSNYMNSKYLRDK